MWKKDESKGAAARTEPTERTIMKSPTGGQSAVISESLTVHGEITGQTDLLISGTVDGEINLPHNLVTICESGTVTAKIQAGVIVVEGQAKGDLVGTERVEIKRSGTVEGNIISPRVGLEDGARFKGNIDMTSGTPSYKASQKAASTSDSDTLTSSKDSQNQSSSDDDTQTGDLLEAQSVQSNSAKNHR